MKEKKRNAKKAIIVAAIVILVAIVLSLTEFFTNWLWFSEVGYTNVFFKQLVTQLTIGVPTFIVIGILAYLYLSLLKKSYFKQIASSEETNIKRLRLITIALSVVASALVTIVVVKNLWFEILQYANSTDFNITDPIFKLDISFYIFKLEFLDKFNELLIGIVVGFFALTLIYYAVLLTVRTPDMFEEGPSTESEQNGRFDNATGKFAKVINMGRVQPRRKLDSPNVKRLLRIASGKLALLGIIFFVMLAIDFALAQFELLQGHNGAVYGAGFTDVTVTLWQYRILMGLSIVAAALFAPLLLKKKYKQLVILPVAMVLVGVLGGLVGSLVQNYIVSPDELNKESKYLAYNVEYTQYAYGLDNVQVKPFAADNTLTAKDILDNPETIENIRINDFDPAKQFYNQTQSIRQYYTFFDVDNDRYWVNGEYTQAFLAAREIDESRISDTWLNKHIKYTHGYGVALSRVDQVTASGQPDVLIGNIPPVTEVKEIQITRPEIYFGELSNEYVIVGTNEEEFDYPDGDTNAYTKYQGTAGIKLNFFNKILFAVKEGSLKLFTSSNITSESKIIINRNIVDRVLKIMPYLSYEGDPYMVISDGKLYWMMDAFTKSSMYPYSEPYARHINYIRNSVKVVIDCYNGDVNFYIVDEADPIAKTFQKIYPTLFKNADEMPGTLKEHIRYPSDLFDIQARVYAKYHMEDIPVFYQSEDLWDLAYEIYQTEKVQIEPNYYIAKLPGESKAEFFNSIPFTPRSKQNMTALMVARNDGEHYGELILYQLPKSKATYGTEQIEAQIDQNTEISKEFTLWTSAGTSYRRGNLFVIPINSSLLYVEPVYLEAQNSSIPEVKRIIVAYNDKIAYAETLEDCLVQIFGNGVKGDPEEDPDKPDVPVDPDQPDDPDDERTVEELAAAAKSAYDKAIAAQKAGDWALYGKYLQDLENYLNMIAK